MSWRTVAWPLRTAWAPLGVVQRNILANLFNRGWALVLAVVLVPFYLQFLGVEAYGLVGFFAMLQAAATLLDWGLSTTLNRELARASAVPGQGQSARDVVRTLESWYWAVGILLAVGVVAMAPRIAHDWVRVRALSPASVERAVAVMGFVLAAQWPLSLYTGGLMGLQRQALLSGINSLAATIRGVGAVLILWLVSPTITAFFLWQGAVSLAHTTFLAATLWRALPPGERPARPRLSVVSRVWRFAAGISATSVLGLVLTQMDKLLLTRLLRLDQFGYYSLACTLTVGLLMVPVAPVTDALFPRLTQAHSRGDGATLARYVHQGSQVVSVFVWPAAVVLALFAEPILALWTRNATIAGQTHAIVAVMAVATACQAMMAVPVSLQYAVGWTRLAFFQNLVSIAALAPCLWFLASRLHGLGGALAWCLVMGAHLVVVPQIVFRRLLPGHVGRWYGRDVARPLFAVLLVALLGRWATGTHEPLWMVAAAFGVWSAALGLAAVSAPVVRDRVIYLMTSRLGPPAGASE